MDELHCAREQIAQLLEASWLDEPRETCAAGAFAFPASWDVDGVVRVVDHAPPVVEVTAIVAEAPATLAVLRELNDLNRVATFVRFHCDDDQLVWVSRSFMLSDNLEADLWAAIEHVRNAVTRFGTLLQALGS